jgi:hypothetical protein
MNDSEKLVPDLNPSLPRYIVHCADWYSRMILRDHRAASYRRETPRACAVRKTYRVVNLAEERRTLHNNIPTILSSLLVKEEGKVRCGK